MDLFDALVDDQVDEIVVLGDTGTELTVITPADKKTASGVCKAEDYQLPGNITTDIYIVPVSGGADSSVTAMLMCEMFPDVNWRFCFTDTGAEEPGIYDTLDSLETYLGRSIDRVLPKKDLWELLDQYGNFLPSATSRWCTRQKRYLLMVGLNSLQALKSGSSWVSEQTNRSESRSLSMVRAP